jgi:hypothetical protein
VTCPRCLREIPNPALPECSGAPGAERALAIDAEVRGDRGRIGCGVVLLLALLVLGLAFVWSFGMAATKSAGRYGDNLLMVWFGVGGIGAILVLILATIAAARPLLPRVPETAETGRFERRIMQALAIAGALCIGIVAAVVVFGLTCAAILGGAAVGGW